ncbi:MULTISPECIES: RDD family protein [Paenibacillus]|uniref:RDD family protein n=1 Tax=Paenibacillus TaxID=44249 RepID=UPI0022B92B30|nr:RDD family protein [Paenibacillus caseinilyticus]MCZ8520173.1 RDD family protein [Paenibacillus caseinilyticus]
MTEHPTWHYKNKEGTAGPFHLEEIKALVRAGTIRRTTLLQADGEDPWRPADYWSELPWASFEQPHNPTVRPWMRYWARSLDMLLWVMALDALLAYVPVAFLPPASSLLLSVLFGLLWLPVEILLLALWGTTPGKLLFGVKVRRTDGGKAALPQAARRSVKLLWRGLGLGLPLISMFTMLNAHHELHKHGQASWDRDSGLLVHYRPTNWAEQILVWILIALLVYARLYGWLEKMAALTLGSTVL